MLIQENKQKKEHDLTLRSKQIKMKIKQNEAVKAYRSLQDLNKQKVSSGNAKIIYDLFKKVSPAFEFQTQEEKKILTAHPEFDPNLGGIRLENKTDEQKKEAANEIKQIEQEFMDLADLDFEVEGLDSPIEINLMAEPNLKLSGEDIGNLEKLIVFN